MRYFKWPSMQIWQCQIHNAIWSKMWKITVVFLSRISVYYCKFLRRFSLSRIAQISFEEKLLINHLNKQKHGYLINTWSDKLFKGTFVKQALPSLYGGSRKITCTVPLSYFFIVTQKLYQNVKYKDILKKSYVYIWY